MSTWLGKGRFAKLATGDAQVTRFRGPLRGVTGLSLEKVARAQLLVALNTDEGVYFVYDPAYVPGVDAEKDEEGGFQWVNLVDKDVDRCHCRDFLYRGERDKTICKHILAAMLEAQDPQVLAFIRELEEDTLFRSTLARAIKKPITD